ncbi:hypothetical protein [Streptomyces sp. Da 82-17]|uniref:hypothetical protein n=1 Tax=Streptomyces sp. Da 82-17 TaxID=3377116 RepID=UPI0038D4C43C
MHRTRAVAGLLIVMTASAVSGCVSVGGAAVPHARSDAGHGEDGGPLPAPQNGRADRPKIVTAPADEALRLMRPVAPKSTDSLRVPEQAKHRRSPAGPRPDDARRPEGTADRGQGEESADGPRIPSLSDSPVRPKHLLPGEGVCGLGERYGQWGPDSPQARICRGAYGS